VIDDTVLDQLKHCTNIVVGIQQVKREILSGRVSSVVLAIDTDVGYQLGLVKTCNINNVPIVRVNSSRELGVAIGIEVKAGCVGIMRLSVD
jgi:ribosomal protein L7Ae-like RNA K-turn-binding protein